MRTAIAIVAAGLIQIAGCAITSIQKVGEHSLSQSVDATRNDIEALLHECWSREAAFFGPDGIEFRMGGNQGSTRYTVGRWNRDIGFKPFAFVTISGDARSSQVVVEEGDAVFGGAYHLYESVEKWLGGDRACPEVDVRPLSKAVASSGPWREPKASEPHGLLKTPGAMGVSSIDQAELSIYRLRWTQFRLSPGEHTVRIAALVGRDYLGRCDVRFHVEPKRSYIATHDSNPDVVTVRVHEELSGAEVGVARCTTEYKH